MSIFSCTVSQATPRICHKECPDRSLTGWKIQDVIECLIDLQPVWAMSDEHAADRNMQAKNNAHRSSRDPHHQQLLGVSRAEEDLR